MINIKYENHVIQMTRKCIVVREESIEDKVKLLYWTIISFTSIL